MVDVESIGRSIQKEVYDNTNGLTCSIGISCNRMLSKICSDINKPNGIYVLENEPERIK